MTTTNCLATILSSNKTFHCILKLAKKAHKAKSRKKNACSIWMCMYILVMTKKKKALFRAFILYLLWCKIAYISNHTEGQPILSIVKRTTTGHQQGHRKRMHMLSWIAKYGCWHTSMWWLPAERIVHVPYQKYNLEKYSSWCTTCFLLSCATSGIFPQKRKKDKILCHQEVRTHVYGNRGRHLSKTCPKKERTQLMRQPLRCVQLQGSE